MAKTAARKIADVTTPEEIKPSATGRPILITDKPRLAPDPMLSAAGSDESDKTAPLTSVSRTAKTIRPLPATYAASKKTAEIQPDTAEVPPAVEQSDEPKESEAVKEDTDNADQPAAAEPTGRISPLAGIHPIPAEQDGDEAPTDVEPSAADAAREAEIDKLVESGKYFVPINAVARKRSRIFVACLAVCIVVLAVATLDIALDTGIIKTGLSVPHTHLFSGK